MKPNMKQVAQQCLNSKHRFKTKFSI